MHIRDSILIPETSQISSITPLIATMGLSYTGWSLAPSIWGWLKVFWNNYMLFIIAAFFATSQSFAAPQTSLSLYGSTKHGDNFKYYKHVNPKAPKGGSITFAANGTFDSLNPFVIKGTPAQGLVPLSPYYFYVTLMDQSFNESFSQYPLLAESVELAKDGLSMTYNLRKEATFHDGSSITADDVVFSFNILMEKGSPLYRQYYADVQSIEKLSPVKVKFTFKDTTNKELPLLLGSFPIVSKAYYTTHDFGAATLKIPLGNGPYRIEKVDPGRSITYERVKNWWGEKLPVNVGRYNVDELRYVYFRDPDVAFEAFKSHEYDIRLEGEIKKWMTGYDDEDIKSGALKKLELTSLQAGIMTGLVMNTRRSQFQDPNVRRALALALDFEWLNENYFYDQYERNDSYFWGLDLASSGLIGEAERKILEPYKDQLPADVFESAYTLPKTDGTGRDRRYLRQAQKMLREAGYIMKSGRLVHGETGKPFVIEILLPLQNYTRYLSSYVKSLGRLGIIANFRIIDMAQYMARIEDFDFDMVINMFAQSNSPGNEQREFWGSEVADVKGSRNLPGIKDPVVDALIEKLIDAPDRETLVAITKSLDRDLLWGHYVVPLWGSKKTRIAYWSVTKGTSAKGESQLNNTGDFSNYNIDLASWWVELPV